MSKIQWIYVAVTAILILGSYFGFETKPPEQKLVEKSRANSFESIDIGKLVRDQKGTLSENDQQYFSSLEALAAATPDDSSQIRIYEQLAGEWYRRGNKVISGHFAEKIANLDNTASRWSITGTTFGAALKSDLEPNTEDYAFDHAVSAFENAVSLDPENLDHRVNLAIMYAEHPIEENPMKGIMMMLELNRQNPESVDILYHLARFGMQTGQYEKAIGRIEKALTIDPDNQKVICLAAKAYRAVNNNEKFAAMNAACENKLND